MASPDRTIHWTTYVTAGVALAGLGLGILNFFRDRERAASTQRMQEQVGQLQRATLQANDLPVLAVTGFDRKIEVRNTSKIDAVNVRVAWTAYQYSPSCGRLAAGRGALPSRPWKVVPTIPAFTAMTVELDRAEIASLHQFDDGFACIPNPVAGMVLTPLANKDEAETGRPLCSKDKPCAWGVRVIAQAMHPKTFAEVHAEQFFRLTRRGLEVGETLGTLRGDTFEWKSDVDRELFAEIARTLSTPRAAPAFFDYAQPFYGLGIWSATGIPQRVDQETEEERSFTHRLTAERERNRQAR
jgi:hypothetical protein